MITEEEELHLLTMGNVCSEAGVLPTLLLTFPGFGPLDIAAEPVQTGKWP